MQLHTFRKYIMKESIKVMRFDNLKITNILLLALAACMLMLPASAGYSFDENITDEYEYAEQGAIIVSAFRDAGPGTLLQINGDDMDYLQFMAMYYAYHPVTWLREGHKVEPGTLGKEKRRLKELAELDTGTVIEEPVIDDPCGEPEEDPTCDRVYVRGHWQKEWKDGYYKTLPNGKEICIPGHYYGKWIPGYWKTVCR